MDSELLQSFVRSGPTAEDDAEPSRLYPPKEVKEVEQQQQKKKKKEKNADAPTPPPPNIWGRRKNVIVIEQRKYKTIALAIDECYCDKDRAAAVSFGYVDIKCVLYLTKCELNKLNIRQFQTRSENKAHG